jgi:hypothetical protein
MLNSNYPAYFSAASKAVSYAETAGSTDDSHVSQAGTQRHSSGKELDSGLKESDGASAEGWSSSEQTGSDSGDSDDSGASSDLASEESYGGSRLNQKPSCASKPLARDQHGTGHVLMGGDKRCVWTSDAVSLNQCAREMNYC